MKLVISKSKNAASLYVVKSIYVNGKHTSKVVEKLGTIAELQKKLNGQDPVVWAKEYIKPKLSLNRYYESRLKSKAFKRVLDFLQISEKIQSSLMKSFRTKESRRRTSEEE